MIFDLQQSSKKRGSWKIPHMYARESEKEKIMEEKTH